VEYETGNMIPDPMTGELIPEVLTVQEEYVPKFDITVSIGVEKPQDREYWVNLAFTLLKQIDPLTGQPMIDTQAVQYTIENGRMEPFEVISERIQRDQMIMQRMQEMEQQIQQLGAENQQLQQVAGHAQQQLQVVNEQERMFNQQERVAKMDLERDKLDLQAAKQFQML